MGHINNAYLKKTAACVKGFDKIEKVSLAKSSYDVIDCIACCKGKLAKLPTLLRTEPRATDIGERLHVDIGGPVGQSTPGGCDYYILFKDEFTNFRFIFILKSRSEAYDCIRKTLSRIMADTQHKIRCIISDNGSEFTSNRTQDLFVSESIKHIYKWTA